jgi:cell wall-associated NlpC family hydrolase
MRALLIATLALPLAMLSLARQDGAHASPARTTQLESQLEQLNQQSDQLVEQYLQAKLGLERTERTLSALRHDADQAEQTLRAAQQRLGTRAAAAYVQGPGNDLAALLGATDPSDTIDRVQLLELLARQDGDLMATLDIANKNYDTRKRALEATQHQQAQEVAALASRKDEASRAADRTQALLSQLKAADRARLLAAANHAAQPGSGSSGSGSSGSQPSFPKVTASGAAAKAVAFAKAQVGEPYQFGGSGPSSWDCSGLTMVAWAQAGVSLPHSSAAQYDVTRHVSAGELQPGDLIFYYSPISHVAMFVGGGMQVAATHTGDFVRLQPLHSGIVGYGRPAG